MTIVATLKQQHRNVLTTSPKPVTQLIGIAGPIPAPQAMLWSLSRVLESLYLNGYYLRIKLLVEVKR
jgi:hypothetical protein